MIKHVAYLLDYDMVHRTWLVTKEWTDNEALGS